jgi:hypothetical protein
LGVIAFFDASALIYFVEGSEPFASRARKALARLLKQFPNNVQVLRLRPHPRRIPIPA